MSQRFSRLGFCQKIGQVSNRNRTWSGSEVMRDSTRPVQLVDTLFRFNWVRNIQLVVVLLCAALVKFYYSTASVNDLRWILAPTASLVELISGTHFEFESHAGYMSSDHTFLIAAPCAGVNFLITAFLMLALRKLWRDRANVIRWSFISNAAVLAYLATLLANTARISIALQLRRTPLDIGLSPDQLHRFEGIFVYFGFLLVMFWISEQASYRSAHDPQMLSTSTEPSSNRFGWLRASLFPLLVYYGVTLGIPLANGAYRKGTDFAGHAIFVLATPLLLIVPVIGVSFILKRQSWIDHFMIQGARQDSCSVGRQIRNRER